MAYPTDDEIRAALRGMLQLGEQEELNPRWLALIPAANATAIGDVKAALIARGYTAAQVLTWQLLRFWCRQQALFWLLTEGGGLHDYDDKFINKLDRRFELQTLTLLDGNDEEIVPAGDSGVVGHGSLSTAGDSFVPDPNDRRRGVVTRW